MRTILVLNPKGGSGKTTVATNLAAYYALRDKRTALVDLDRQGSSLDWLAARPADRAPIEGVIGYEQGIDAPEGTQYVIIDAPAALHGRPLEDLVHKVQTVVVPVLPSPMDLRAAIRFYDELLDVGRALGRQIKVATVANRIRENSATRAMVEEFLKSLELPDGRALPFVTGLRNHKVYLRAAARGLGIWECPPSMVMPEVDTWRPLLRWLASDRSRPE